MIVQLKQKLILEVPFCNSGSLKLRRNIAADREEALQVTVMIGTAWSMQSPSSIFSR